MAAVSGSGDSKDNYDEVDITNIHGENLASRLEKYKLSGGTSQKTSPDKTTPTSSLNSSETNSESGKYQSNARTKASPTNSAAARAQKAKTKSYELLSPIGSRTQTTYEQLNGHANGR